LALRLAEESWSCSGLTLYEGLIFYQVMSGLAD